MIYGSFKEWITAVWHSIQMFFNALYCIVYLCLIIGIVSLLYYVIRQINAFFRRETIAASIVTLLFLVITFGWVTTFVSERQKRVEAQHRADSLAYDLSKLTQMFDTAETLVINGDTIRNM